MKMEQMMTAKEVAAAVQVSVRTLETLLATGQIPQPVWIGRQRRWDAANFRRWVHANTDEPVIRTETLRDRYRREVQQDMANA